MPTFVRHLLHQQNKRGLPGPTQNAHRRGQVAKTLQRHALRLAASRRRLQRTGQEGRRGPHRHPVDGRAGWCQPQTAVLLIRNPGTGSSRPPPALRAQPATGRRSLPFAAPSTISTPLCAARTSSGVRPLPAGSIPIGEVRRDHTQCLRDVADPIDVPNVARGARQRRACEAEDGIGRIPSLSRSSLPGLADDERHGLDW